MNLVNEQHVARLERGEDAGQIAGFVEHRARRNLEAYTQFVGDDVAQRGLTQARRTVEQRVVERFATVFGSLNKHAEVVNNLALAVEVVEV